MDRKADFGWRSYTGLVALYLSLSLLSLFSGLAYGGEEKCENWKRNDGLEYAGIRLGSSLRDIPPRFRLEKSTPKQRYFDRLTVEVYSGKGVVIETIRCVESGEIVVGISYGQIILGRTTTNAFFAKQKDDLLRAGVRDVNQHIEGREQSLWGIKARFEERNAYGVTDALILRRRCITKTVPDGEDTCGLASWHVHLVRSKQGI